LPACSLPRETPNTELPFISEEPNLELATVDFPFPFIGQEEITFVGSVQA